MTEVNKAFEETHKIELLHIFVNGLTGFIQTHRFMDSIVLKNNQEKKERIGINRYIYRNKRKRNEK